MTTTKLESETYTLSSDFTHYSDIKKSNTEKNIHNEHTIISGDW